MAIPYVTLNFAFPLDLKKRGNLFLGNLLDDVAPLGKFDMFLRCALPSGSCN